MIFLTLLYVNSCYKGKVKLKFFKSIGIYTIVNVLDKAIPFLMLPILTHYLTPEEFGIVAMYLVFISFLFPFVGLNIHGAITRQYIDRDKIDIASYVTNSLYILLATSLGIYVLMNLFDTHILNYFHIGSDWFQVIILITMAMVVSEIVLSIFNISHKPVQFGIYKILRTLFIYSFIYFLVVVNLKGWQGRINGLYYGEITFGVVGIFLLVSQKLIRFNFKPEFVKNALKFGMPLIPHAFGAVVISMSDRLLITNLIGIDATGVYVVAIQIGVILSVIIGSIKQAWTPLFFEKIKVTTSENKKEMVKLTYMVIGVLILLTLFFTVTIKPFIPYLIDEKFIESKRYIFWIVMGFSMQGIYHLFAGYMFYSNKTYILMLLTFVLSILNIFFSFFFIKNNGAVGAAQGTLLSYLIIVMITWYMSHQIMPMPWNMIKWRKK